MKIKQLLFIIAFSAFSFASMSQEWQMTVGTSAKTLKYIGTEAVQSTGYIGEKDGIVFLLRRTDNNKSLPYLGSYDRNLNVVAETELPKDKECDFYGGYVNETSVDLIMAKKSKSDYKAYKLSYDPSTLKALGEPQELLSVPIPQGTTIYPFIESSASSEWNSLILAIVRNDNVEWRISTFDPTLDELWNMDVSVGSVNDWMVTDSADVISAGYVRDKKTNETRLYFSVFDGEREHAYRATHMMDEVNDMRIVRYDNGKIYCTGLLKGEAQDKLAKWSSGFYSLVFDTRTGEVAHYEKVDFTKEMICDLCNVPSRTKMKILSSDRISFASSKADVDGATVAYERIYNLYVNGDFSYSDYVGLLVYRIDNDGKVAWNRTVPREVKASYNARDGVCTRLTPAGDSYTIFYIDDPGNVNPKPGTIAKEGGSNHNKMVLMALTFDKQGNITRQGLEVPSKSVCIGAPHRLANGDYLQILSQPFHSVIAILKLK
ncbi:MAG: hypothetical protein K6D59_08685 [Bacteroidales bacterium]|nr:hypothetical protein [Bacteroidales bacterium]